ncbi:MAG: FO synthase [Halieaceae bacterium]|jgi:FO synthase
MDVVVNNDIEALWKRLGKGLPTDLEALHLASCTDTARLMELAARLRDASHRNVVTFSPKVFIPLTHLCRDVCHYCTFAQTPRHIEQAYMSVEQVLEVCRKGAKLGCREALLTLGEKPELRYRAAREALADLGFESTLDYVAHVAEAIHRETDLLPHINAGCMTAAEIAKLRSVSASMGIMLESSSPRLGEKGMPHYGSPDKDPEVRLETLELAGQACVPFTSGILIGIGETRVERVESLLAIRASHLRHRHIQEIIVQNFRAKKGTLMANATEPDLDELLWTIAVARIIFGGDMSVQAPPNLSPGVLPQLIGAGINDWGGVSPLTPDYVNPEAPWPNVEKLAAETALSGKYLQPRLTIYPSFVLEPERWLDEGMRTTVLQSIDTEGYARTDQWSPGEPVDPPTDVLSILAQAGDATQISSAIKAVTDKAIAGEKLSEDELVCLFSARGEDLGWVCHTADLLREKRVGKTVSYVVNRNINYTNICYFKCQFCAFSKGKLSENLRGLPYDLDDTEIQRRCVEAWERGATEVCMQGGIHPDYTGQTYLDIVGLVKQVVPGMHIHAFSPLEIWQGAKTMGLDVSDFLVQLKQAGLGSLPGTAAEILDDEVRAILCPDKINTQQWLDVVASAHQVGLNTTATIMYGHVESTRHWARHLLQIRDLQAETGGLTEFVPLPFVHMEAPLYLKGRARRGPTFRESVLMHAVSRIALYQQIDNIQTSWVKMGARGVEACLQAGANDLGGSLMNETITRSAGARHGQEWSAKMMIQQIEQLDRHPKQRSTCYTDVDGERIAVGRTAGQLSDPVNTPARRYERPTGKRTLVRNEVGSGESDLIATSS